MLCHVPGFPGTQNDEPNKILLPSLSYFVITKENRLRNNPSEWEKGWVAERILLSCVEQFLQHRVGSRDEKYRQQGETVAPE